MMQETTIVVSKHAHNIMADPHDASVGPSKGVFGISMVSGENVMYEPANIRNLAHNCHPHVLGDCILMLSKKSVLLTSPWYR